MAPELVCACRKRFASGFALDAGLRVPTAEAAVTVLFGPSGAGKTSLLRMIAGLEQPDDGAIVFHSRVWFDGARRVSLPPQQRRAGFLFQDYALFPHLTAAANVEFAGNRERARQLMDAFALTDLAGRLPRHLSGGQQQRVALARALAAGPALLLLDEPLSALDAATRVRMRRELRRTLVESGVPSLLVTHDRTEAIALGDWIAVMVEGRIRQLGPVHEVFRRPADPLVAESLGVENVLEAEIVSRGAGVVTLKVGCAQMQAVDSGENGPVFACIRAEDVALTREPLQTSSARNRLTGRVSSVAFEGPLARVEIECGFTLVAVVTAQSATELSLQPGEAICAVVKATSVHLTPALQFSR